MFTMKKHVSRRAVIKPSFSVNLLKLDCAGVFPSRESFLGQVRHDLAALAEDLFARFAEIRANPRHAIIFKEPGLASGKLQSRLGERGFDRASRLLPTALVDEVANFLNIGCLRVSHLQDQK